MKAREPKLRALCPPGTANRSLCEMLPPSALAKRRARHHRKHPGAATKSQPPRPAKPVPVATPTPVGSLPSPLPIPSLPISLASAEVTAVNFLIGVFPVPPFLLPIYEAAAVDYAVPWQVLAAINEVETDYGRNLSTSSAGAVGWMQFLPSTWTMYGMDADGRGSANPYDPVDAIFAAARYLHAAGAESDLSGAIFAYNHAGWYVDSVELRAQLLQYLPEGLVDGLTGLMEALYPVAGHLGRYATEAPLVERVGRRPAVLLRGPPGAPVIATADARVVAIGRDAQRGMYITIEDAYGNRFTYSGLGSVASVYPVLKPRVESALEFARKLGSVPDSVSASAREAVRLAAKVLRDPAPASAAGARSSDPAGSSAGRTWIATPPPVPFIPMAKERLFADPARPASYAAGGRLQLESSLSAYAAAADIQVSGHGSADYFSQPLQLKPSEFTLAPLARGAIVAAGTILGRVARSHRGSTGLMFQIRPAGAAAPVDPRPIIAGWELLGRLTAGRQALVGGGLPGAFGVDNASLGQLLMAGKPRLERAVLSDRRVTIDGCDRRGIEAGRVDRRALAVIEYLSYSGLDPTASGLACAVAGASAAPARFEILDLNGIPVAGRQRYGGIVDLTIRRLLALQGDLRPSRIVSGLRYPLEPTVIASPNDTDRIEVDFAPASSDGAKPLGGRLDTAQWTRLIARLTQLSRQQP